MGINHTGPATLDLESVYTYEPEGRMTSVQSPAGYYGWLRYDGASEHHDEPEHIVANHHGHNIPSRQQAPGDQRESACPKWRVPERF